MKIVSTTLNYYYFSSDTTQPGRQSRQNLESVLLRFEQTNKQGTWILISFAGNMHISEYN